MNARLPPPYTPLRSPRDRGFTFIELLVALALSLLLLRGMYTIFYSATSLTRLSEEKMAQLLEVSAFYEFASADMARVPYALTRQFSVSDTTISFRASPRVGANDVYIKYEYNAGTNQILRGVYTNEGCTTGTDDDGDGVSDVGMVLSRNVINFDVKYLSAGDINGTWSTGSVGPPPAPPGLDTTPRAIRFIVRQATVTPGGELPEETFLLILPVMFL